MDYIFDELSLSIVSGRELLLRVGLAMLFSAVIGLDRDRKKKPMDFRAFMIIAASSCILAVMGQELYADYAHVGEPVLVDLSKIISGVMTGIGFLGAGAILKRGDDVVGTATGASIWASGAIGLALGFGFYLLGLMAFIAVSLTLIVGGLSVRTVRGETDEERGKAS
ncbi:MgtC/SapB family protein [Kordiimonas sp.]|uniref:MgtC/SapB family protein n=1 Tax=Kordiimonas sp. TaxID=1970157 RepID=UPI003A8DFFF9